MFSKFNQKIKRGLPQVKTSNYHDLQQVELLNTMAGQHLRVSVFYIDGMVIDTGPSRKLDVVESLFDTWDVERVVCTHHHEDHTGGASHIAQKLNIPIYMHDLGTKICAKRASLPLYRRLYWGNRLPFKSIPLEATFQTKDYTWDVLHTPGHADDHVALYNREKKWMFGGDLYVYPTPKSMFAFESLPEMIASLEKVLTYDFDVYICSHAGVIEEGRKAVEHKLSYLRKVQADVRALHKEGFSPRTIRKQLFPKKHRMHYLSFFENSPHHMVRSVLE